jgi:hypothetical protein
MQLRPDALRFVLAQGLPATIEVVGASMEPTIAKGAKVRVVAWPAGEERPGEIVLLATEGDETLLLHRVMHVFDEAGRRYVIHQGDTASSLFAVVARDAVLGRMSVFAPPDGRPAPTPERLDAPARARFSRRRAACLAFVAARRAARLFGLAERPALRAWGRRLRSLASRVVG